MINRKQRMYLLLTVLLALHSNSLAGEDAAGTALHRAVVSGDMALVASILATEDNIDNVDSRGYTPLHLAAEVSFEKRWTLVWSAGEEKGFHPESDNYEEIAIALIEKGANINCRNREGHTPLHLAASTFNVDVAKVLLSNGAEINALAPAFPHGYSPLMFATSSFHEIHDEQLDMVRLLIRWGSKVGTVSEAGASAPGYMLGLASRRAGYYKSALYAQIFDLLYNCGWPDSAEEFPLHAAIKRGNLNKVQSLLDRGEDVNGRDRDGRTPLHCAAIWNRADIATLLVELNPDFDIRVNRSDLTPLHYAARWGSISVVKTLVEKAEIDSVDSNGNTPLHLAVRHARLTVIKVLLRKGANIDHENEHGETPRDWAIDPLRGWRSQQLQQLFEVIGRRPSDQGEELQNQPLQPTAEAPPRLSGKALRGLDGVRRLNAQ